MLYPHVSFSRHRHVVGNANVETSVWKQIKQNLTGAVSLQAKQRGGLHMFCLKYVLAGETVRFSPGVPKPVLNPTFEY